MAEETNKEILEETDENLTEGITDVTDGTTGEGTTEGTPGEGVTDETTTGNGYLTKPYLVRNLQTFWGKIKQYITNQISGFVSKDYVDGAVGNKADKTALESLTVTVDGKVDKVPGQGLSTNDFTTVEKNKLEGIAENANNYNHPTDSGNKHIPSGGSEGQILRWDSNGTAVWGDDSNTTYSEATTSAAGLMSVTDKAKLDGIENGATKVTVDSEWDSKSENPAQSKVISAELAKKVDKEADPLDPSGLVLSESIQGYATNEGQIVLKFLQNTKHLKIYAPNSDRPIEKVSLWEENSLIFTNFREENGKWAITIENPKGTNEAIAFGESFDFYIETLESIGSPKYKPFIIQITRTSELNQTEVSLVITKIL